MNEDTDNTAETRRRGRLRRFFGAATRPARRLTRSWYHFDPTGVYDREAQRATRRSLWQSVRDTLAQAARDRHTPPGFDFEQMIAAWGIEPEEVDTVARNLWREAIGYAVLIAGGLYVAYRWSDASWLHVINAVVLIAVGMVGTFNRIWRSHLLRTRRYVPFLNWLFGG